MTLPPPNTQNLAIIEAWEETTSHLMIDAYAGTGKTTQLQYLAQAIGDNPDVLMVAFNKKNALDLASKMPSSFNCTTLNALGHRAIMQALPVRVNLDSNKLSPLINTLAEEYGFGKLSQDEWSDVSTLVRMARVQGLVPSSYTTRGWKSLLPDDPDTWKDLADNLFLDVSPDLLTLARQVLEESCRLCLIGTIDFDDQIYFSVLGSGSYRKYSIVMVDEAQDLSQLNHRQLKKSLKHNGRLVVVGDPKQAIYAFRGASSESMEQIPLLFNKEFTRHPLSLTYRCPKAVVARQQGHVPGYEAAEANAEGRVLDWRNMEEWNFSLMPTEKFAVLCRNTAPLLSFAFRCIKNRIGVTMLGRDIGQNLIKLLLKITKKEESLPLEEALVLVQEWHRKEVSKAVANGKEGMVAGIDDRAECLYAVAQADLPENATVKDMTELLRELFENSGGNIILSTGHRAKGMEWETVVVLDPWRIPSKYAVKANERGDDSQLKQEFNLRYVMETRAKVNLILANLKELEIS